MYTAEIHSHVMPKPVMTDYYYIVVWWLKILLNGGSTISLFSTFERVENDRVY